MSNTNELSLKEENELDRITVTGEAYPRTPVPNTGTDNRTTNETKTKDESLQLSTPDSSTDLKEPGILSLSNDDAMTSVEIVEDPKDPKHTVSPNTPATPPSDKIPLRAYLALWTSFCGSVWSVALGSVWGIYQRTMTAENAFPGATTFQLSAVGSISFGFSVVGAILSGPLVDRFSLQLIGIGGSIGLAGGILAMSWATQLWHLYLCSILVGTSGAVVYSCGQVQLPPWFPKRRALAVGIFASGSGIGGFVLTAITQACISAGGWRFSFRILSAIALAWMGSASLLFKRRIPAQPRKSSLFDAAFWRLYFRNPTFVLLFAAEFFIMLPYFAPTAFIPLMLFDGGYSNATGAAVVSGFSATMALGRIVGGLLADGLGELNVFLLACTVPCFATFCIWMPAPTLLGTTTAGAILWAFFCGAPMVTIPLLMIAEYGIENLGSTMGVLFVAFLPGEMCGNIIAGAIVQAYTVYSSEGVRLYAEYRPMLAYLGAMWFGAAVCAAVLRVKKVGRKFFVKV